MLKILLLFRVCAKGAGKGGFLKSKIAPPSSIIVFIHILKQLCKSLWHFFICRLLLDTGLAGAWELEYGRWGLKCFSCHSNLKLNEAYSASVESTKGTVVIAIHWMIHITLHRSSNMHHKYGVNRALLISSIVYFIDLSYGYYNC